MLNVTSIPGTSLRSDCGESIEVASFVYLSHVVKRNAGMVNQEFSVVGHVAGATVLVLAGGEGWRLSQIGKIRVVSKQRIQQILHRK